jgi:hypothetical protein
MASVLSSSAVRDALQAGAARTRGTPARPSLLRSTAASCMATRSAGNWVSTPPTSASSTSGHRCSGVFAVEVKGLPGGPHRGAANLGYRPSANQVVRPLLEVHLLDFSADIYGAHLNVRFLHKLRDEVKFPRLRRAESADRQRRRSGQGLLPVVRTAMADYKKTLNLTDTPFPMRGDLARREPRSGLPTGRRLNVSTRASARPRKAARVSSSTTVRRTPMATFTSATRSTKFSRTSSFVRANTRRLRRALRPGVGLSWPADRTPDREAARQARPRRPCA